MLRAIRGEENLRMKNFRGVGLGLPNIWLEQFGRTIEEDLTRYLKIPVYLQDRNQLITAGELWLKDCAGMIDSRFDRMDIELNGVYGAAKLVIDKMQG